MDRIMEIKNKIRISEWGDMVRACRGSGTWLITKGEKQEDGDWLFFGYCHIFCWEWGYVTLSELESVGFIEYDIGYFCGILSYKF